ncbi:molybdopterin synthase sulfur carrier subunit [Algibacillus agarilyticus]|uniref:molybdopterin synthase sulfur carrier subunit n=1 Tax=Algibacillus agarilyticus TaxID=2234133 RepID=UPI000DCF743B|nr:molybdopterin synthase sulfur carrier subunit [Algibacillus agarilyticus]
MIRVLFFAQLRETLGSAGTEVPHDESATVADLKAFLMSKGDSWQQAFSNGKVLCAVNQTMVQDDEKLCDSDEVAFFPPVTGG